MAHIAGRHGTGGRYARWLARLMHLPDAVEGVIYDTASISTLHALAAAREVAVPDVRTRTRRP